MSDKSKPIGGGAGETGPIPLRESVNHLSDFAPPLNPQPIQQPADVDKPPTHTGEK